VAIVDHLGITVEDVARGIVQFDPILTSLGFVRQGAEGSGSWWVEGEPEIILMPPRSPGTGPHVHGRVGWQHLALAVDSREEVDRLHALALELGWSEVRGPKEYPRFSRNYYAAFVEDDNGIRLEFMNQQDGAAGD